MRTEQDELRRCDGCRTTRLCRLYRELWLCISGPQKCWKRRHVIGSARR
jgi:hypothetical protein